jgi:diguanylate cyclase (GGDEF)-like protein/PAS domain S-box-containing protein
LLNSTIEGIVVFDEERKAILANRVFASFFGYSEEEIIGMSAFEFVAPESRELVKRKIRVSDQKPYEALMLRKDGTKFWAILRGRNVVLDGKPVRISSVLDISILKEKEKRILFLANHDALTGLYNRRFFLEVLLQRIRMLKRSGRYGALLFTDLDDFKEINDTMGHDKGDAVLVAVTERIVSCIRKSDVVARIGGDEFVILLNLDADSMEEAAVKSELTADKILHHIRAPITIEEHEIRIGASIGIALMDGRTPADDLLKYADIAMYEAKRTGKNRIVFFDRDLHRTLQHRIETLTNLRRAVHQNEFTLLLQRQVKLEGSQKRTVGFEALIRWRHDGRLIPPDYFVPIAEESGLIVPIGNYVLREIAKILKAWRSDTCKNRWRVSVNISPRQFAEESFVDRIDEVIHHNGLDPERLRLEITENVLLRDFEESLEKIGALKKLGVSLSIDDFGTGFSSLSYLKRLPVDELKIDRSFIERIETDTGDRVIVEAVATMGRKLGLEVIAEGVETEGQLSIVKELGIDLVQGHIFGTPQPPEEL